MELELIKPSEIWRDKYYTMLDQFIANGEHIDAFNIGYESRDFEFLLKRLNENVSGINLPYNFVPNTTFWLKNSNNDLIGIFNLRHTLNESLEFDGGHIGFGITPPERKKGYATTLLKMGLNKAKDFGLERVMLSVNVSNLPSIRVIEKNNGVLEMEQMVDGEASRNYWINL